MEFRHLRYFIAVAEELHFGNAAQRLNISQPPLSAQIKELEHNLNVQLLERTNRSVALTEAGEYLYELSVQMLARLEKETAILQEIDRGERGKIAIGFGGSVVFQILPRVLTLIKKQYPKLEIHVSQLTTKQQIQALLTGDIDLALLVPPVGEEELSTYPFYEEKFIVCLPKSHPLASSTGPIEMKDVSNEPLIISPREAGEGYFEAVRSLYIKSNTVMNIAQYSTEQQTMVSLVAAEFGISFVPESTSHIQHHNVVYKEIDVTHYKETVLTWHKHTQTPLVHGVVELLKTFKV
ncbi:hypothetical protein DH09_16875 [Bacillaceae bacterium JMAK1]|nr:hypothetical protein DH09_16875 [Bacillaceae bacterium JMAK1]